MQLQGGLAEIGEQQVALHEKHFWFSNTHVMLGTSERRTTMLKTPAQAVNMSKSLIASVQEYRIKRASARGTTDQQKARALTIGEELKVLAGAMPHRK